MERSRDLVRGSIADALQHNRVLNREHIKFIFMTEGYSVKSIDDLTNELRTGKFEEFTGIPVKEFRIKNKSFFHRSDIPLEMTNFPEIEKGWVTKRKNKRVNYSLDTSESVINTSIKKDR